MNVRLCDICRKEIDSTDRDTINKFSFGNYGIGSWLWHSEFGLCTECGKALNAWLNARKCLSLSKDDEKRTDDDVDDYEEW